MSNNPETRTQGESDTRTRDRVSRTNIKQGFKHRHIMNKSKIYKSLRFVRWRLLDGFTRGSV